MIKNDTYHLNRFPVVVEMLVLVSSLIDFRSRSEMNVGAKRGAKNKNELAHFTRDLSNYYKIHEWGQTLCSSYLKHVR